MISSSDLMSKTNTSFNELIKKAQNQINLPTDSILQSSNDRGLPPIKDIMVDSRVQHMQQNCLKDVY